MSERMNHVRDFMRRACTNRSLHGFDGVTEGTSTDPESRLRWALGGPLARLNTEPGKRRIGYLCARIPGYEQASVEDEMRYSDALTKAFHLAFNRPAAHDDPENQYGLAQVVTGRPRYEFRDFTGTSRSEEVSVPYPIEKEEIDSKRYELMVPHGRAHEILSGARTATHLYRVSVDRTIELGDAESAFEGEDLTRRTVNGSEIRWFFGSKADAEKPCVKERGVAPAIARLDRWPAEAAEPTTRVSIVAFTRFTPDGLYFNQEAFSIAMDGELRILDWRQATGSYVYFYLSDASLLDMLLRPALAERLR